MPAMSATVMKNHDGGKHKMDTKYQRRSLAGGVSPLVKTYTDHMVLQGYYWYGGYEYTKD